MSITDELRKWGYGFCGDTHDVVNSIADRIDAEHEAKVSYWQGESYKDGYDEGFASADDWLAQHEDAMAEHGWVRLPVDADGVPIRVGDVMDGTCPSGKHVNGTVSAIGDGVFWLSNVQFSLKSDYMHHYHAPTVEDVLREMHAELDEVTALYVGEAIDSDERDRDEARIFAEYAKRLTLAGDAE